MGVRYICVVASRFMTKLCAMLNASTLNPKQQRIYEWINDELQLPVYADLFSGAAVFLNQRHPGYVTFVAHAGREIMNGLARTVRGDERNQVQYANRLDAIAPNWEDRWGSSSAFCDAEVPAHHEIPHDVCVKLKSLMDEHKEGRLRNEEINEVFFFTFLHYDDKDNIPYNFMQEWKATRKWFKAHAHVGVSAFDSRRNTQLAEHFYTLENFLYIAARSQHERIRVIDEILDETNG